MPNLLRQILSCEALRTAFRIQAVGLSAVVSLGFAAAYAQSLSSSTQPPSGSFDSEVRAPFGDGSSHALEALDFGSDPAAIEAIRDLPLEAAPSRAILMRGIEDGLGLLTADGMIITRIEIERPERSEASRMDRDPVSNSGNRRDRSGRDPFEPIDVERLLDFTHTAPTDETLGDDQVLVRENPRRNSLGGGKSMLAPDLPHAGRGLGTPPRLQSVSRSGGFSSSLTSGSGLMQVGGGSSLPTMVQYRRIPTKFARSGAGGQEEQRQQRFVLIFTRVQVFVRNLFSNPLLYVGVLVCLGVYATIRALRRA